MFEDIDFQDTNYKVKVTIDNANSDINIKEIVKIPSIIKLNNLLNTSLYDDIIIDASLYYKKDNEEKEMKNDGSVVLTIYNSDKVYCKKNITFNNGIIKDTIPNTLEIGEYICTIEYPGSKYFEPTTLTTAFYVEKRLAILDLEKRDVYGKLKETISILGTLKDKETNKPISLSSINFDFNGNTYTTMSNIDGEVSINIKIPDSDSKHCLSTSENGITFTSYIVSIYMMNENYYLNDVKANVIVEKAPTNITINTLQYLEPSNSINFNGHVIADVLESIQDVNYGNVIIEFLDYNYKHEPVSLTSEGGFSSNINLSKFYDAYNNNINDLETYSTIGTKRTAVVLSGDLNKDNKTVAVGKSIEINGTVKEINKSDPVKDGMLLFTLFDSNNKEVYWYGTELDNTGAGIFTFNTSRTGTYYIKAKYYGMFGYLESETDKFKIEVV